MSIFTSITGAVSSAVNYVSNIFSPSAPAPPLQSQGYSVLPGSNIFNQTGLAAFTPPLLQAGGTSQLPSQTPAKAATVINTISGMTNNFVQNPVEVSTKGAQAGILGLSAAFAAPTVIAGAPAAAGYLLSTPTGQKALTSAGLFVAAAYTFGGKQAVEEILKNPELAAKAGIGAASPAGAISGLITGKGSLTLFENAATAFQNLGNTPQYTSNPGGLPNLNPNFSAASERAQGELTAAIDAMNKNNAATNEALIKLAKENQAAAEAEAERANREYANAIAAQNRLIEGQQTQITALTQQQTAASAQLPKTTVIQAPRATKKKKTTKTTKHKIGDSWNTPKRHYWISKDGKTHWKKR